MEKMKHKHAGIGSSRNLIAMMLVLFAYTLPAHAYLDPGTGSIILQGLIAGVMVVVAAWGVFWQRIKSFFSSLFSLSESAEDQSDQESD